MTLTTNKEMKIFMKDKFSHDFVKASIVALYTIVIF